jgi:serine/threonine-protein kinase RsbW
MTTGQDEPTQEHDDPYANASLAGSLPARPASVGVLRARVTSFAEDHDVEERDLDRIRLAVSEAAANVVRHAYGPDEGGAFHYAVDIEDGDLQVVIADNGRGIRKAGSPAGLGFGLRLIAEESSDFMISHREPTGVEVWMRFVLDAGDDDRTG